MRDELWFKHDVRSRIDPKMRWFIQKTGIIGYGVFWALLEILHYQKDHSLPLEGIEFEGIAAELSLTDPELREFVTVALTAGLFHRDEHRFWQPRLQHEQAERSKLKHNFSASKSDAGKIGGVISAAKKRGATAQEIQLLRSTLQAEASSLKQRQAREEKSRYIDRSLNRDLSNTVEPTEPQAETEAEPQPEPEPHKRKKRAPKPEPADFTFPPKWGPQARACLDRWMAYRVEINKPLKRASYQAQIDEYADNPRKFDSLVRRTIKNGWQGLNEHVPMEDDSNDRLKRKGPHTAASTVEHNLEYIRRRQNGEEDPTGLFDAFIDDQKELDAESSIGRSMVPILIGSE